MNLLNRIVRGGPHGAAVLLLAVASTGALAAPTTDAQALLRQELAVCFSGASNQGRETCAYEARAAHAQNRRGALDDRDANYLRNAARRCDRLEGADQSACVARMQGQGATTGSVSGGGIYRELVIREGAPASADPAPN